MDIQEYTHEIQEIGTLNKKIIKLLGLKKLCGRIVLNPGAIKHIKNKHEEDFQKYFERIPEIIDNPDYAGKNPKIPNSIELVKKLENAVLVSFEIGSNGLIYLSSFYSIGEFTIRKGLSSGRLLAVDLTNVK